MRPELAHAVRVGRRLVGRGGPIKAVGEVALAVDAIDLISYFAVTWPAEDVNRPGGARRSLFHGSGVGLSWDAAFVAAVGEVVERLSLTAQLHLDDPETRPCASWEQLGERAIDPRRLDPYSDEQHADPEFPYPRFTISEPLTWVGGRSLLTGRELLVPAELVFLYHSLPRRHGYTTSSGTASHLDADRAVVSALAELIERDAVMLTWLTRRRVPRLDPASFGDPRIDELCRRIARTPGQRLRLHLLDLTTDLDVPAYLAVLENDGRPAFSLGAAAHLVPAQAAWKAIGEVVHTWNWALAMHQRRGPLAPDAPLVVDDFDDHVYRAAQPWVRPELEFLLDGPLTPAPPPVPELAPAAAVVELTRRLAARGHEALVVDVTLPELRAYGYHAVRALVPGLVPLYCGAGRWMLGSPRLPRGGLNLVPHPFP
jgi:ribosomal protein S12 methylthiotransferase accessory factor